MWGQIAQAIAKIYGENEETKRNSVQTMAKTATDAGKGNNGQDYQIKSADASEGASTSTAPSEQDMSANKSFSDSISDIKSSFSNLGNLGGGENKTSDDEKNKEENTDSMELDTSDERLKNIFGDNEDAVKAFAKINAIQFVYNDKAHEIHPNGEHQVDNDAHYGVKAQELAQNPFTASAVEKDESGYLAVNTPELTMANSAVISEICKRLLVIEKVLGIKVE